MKRDIHPPQCLGCHFSSQTPTQKKYAEQRGIPMAQFVAVHCSIRNELVFKDFSCNKFVEKHEEIR